MAHHSSISDELSLMQRIMLEGTVSCPDQASDDLRKARLTIQDVENVVRCGRVSQVSKLTNGITRYRIETERMCVEVDVPNDTWMRIVTGWRKP